LSQHHRFSTAVVLVLFISVFYDVAPANAFGKISSTPATLTLQEGNSTTTTIELDSPIICGASSPSCQVSLTFSSSDPSLVTFSPSSLTWSYSQWSQIKTFTISVLADQTYKGNQSISVSATAVSASEYYSGFTLSVSVSTIEIDRSPAEIAAEVARVAAAAAEVARVAAAAAEVARVAAANAEAARKAKEQKELTEILAIIPKIAELTLGLGETTKSLYSTKCVKGKTTKYVKYGAKCPKGYKKK
jgi:hypothetical protein